VRAEVLMPDILVPVCSPSLTRGETPLRTPDDLRAHVLLHTASRTHAWPDWFVSVGVHHHAPTEGPAYGHFFMTLQAAIEGRGVALVPRPLVLDDLACGNLVMPFDLCAESSGGYYMLCRHHQWESDRIRRFRDWLLAERDAMT